MKFFYGVISILDSGIYIWSNSSYFNIVPGRRLCYGVAAMTADVQRSEPVSIRQIMVNDCWASTPTQGYADAIKWQ